MFLWAQSIIPLALFSFCYWSFFLGLSGIFLTFEWAKSLFSSTATLQSVTFYNTITYYLSSGPMKHRTLGECSFLCLFHITLSRSRAAQGREWNEKSQEVSLKPVWGARWAQCELCVNPRNENESSLGERAGHMWCNTNESCRHCWALIQKVKVDGNSQLQLLHSEKEAQQDAEGEFTLLLYINQTPHSLKRWKNK